MPITDRALKALKPELKHQFIADGNGLYVRVHTSGTKTFLLRSRRGGKARWVTLGEYPEMSLLEARRAVLEAAGKDLPDRATLQSVYEDWLRPILKSYKRPDHVTARAKAYYLPKLGSRQIASISRAEVTRLLTEIAERAPYAANRTTTDLKSLFAYAADRGFVAVTPLLGLSAKNIGGREAPRRRVLTEAELVRLIGELRTERFAPPTRLALALLLLTGTRSGEVRGISDVEVMGRIWTLPAQRAKNGLAYRVTWPRTTAQLGKLAFKLLGSAPFGSMQAPVLSRAMARIRFDPPATPHDLRRTMATWMAENGVLPHVVEQCLNHKLPGVAGVYNLAVYAAETAAAWRLWARYLMTLKKKAPRSCATGGPSSS